MYESCNRSHLLIAFSLTFYARLASLAGINVTETNNMASDMTSSEAAMSPELN
jgi:hypothetical protein